MAKLRADVLALAFLGFAVVYDLTVYSASILPYILSLSDSDDQASLILSIVISSSALTQVVVGLASGFLARKFSMKIVICLLQTIGMVGILIYAFSGWPLQSVWGIVIGRALCGANTASLGISLAYITTIAKDKVKRTALIANIRAVTVLAAIPSSIMSLILALPFLEFNIGSYQLNAYSYPAWSSLLLQCISFTLNAVFLRFVEREHQHVAPQAPQDGKKQKQLYFSIGVVLILSIFFYDGFYIASLSYALPIVMMEGYEWTIIQYAPVWFGISLIGLFAILFTKTMSKKLGFFSYLLIVPSFGYNCIMMAFMAIGAVGVNRLPPGLGEFLFLFGAETGFAVFQILQTTSSSIFSHVIPPEFIIRMMPLTGAVFAIGKIIGPLFCELEVAIAGVGMIFYVLLVLTAIMMFTSIALSKHFQAVNYTLHASSVVENTDEALLLQTDPNPDK